jgi:hypoxanthine phosphoribosyltransferase
MPDITRIKWSKIINDTILLADKLSHYDVILQISRGGCIPGSLLAYYKNIKDVFTISVQSYNADMQQQTLIMQQIPVELFSSSYASKRILVVDDLSDKGTTLRAIDNLFIERDIHVDFCTLYIKEGTSFIPQYHMDTFSTETWLEFPWDDLKNPFFLT